MRYAAMRSVRDLQVHLLVPEGSGNNAPQEVLRHGPWRRIGGGEVIGLKPEHRLSLARDGYVLVRASPPNFELAHSASIVSLDRWKKSKALSAD